MAPHASKPSTMETKIERLWAEWHLGLQTKTVSWMDPSPEFRNLEPHSTNPDRQFRIEDFWLLLVWTLPPFLNNYMNLEDTWISVNFLVSNIHLPVLLEESTQWAYGGKINFFLASSVSLFWAFRTRLDLVIVFSIKCSLNWKWVSAPEQSGRSCSPVYITDYESFDTSHVRQSVPCTVFPQTGPVHRRTFPVFLILSFYASTCMQAWHKGENRHHCLSCPWVCHSSFAAATSVDMSRRA